MPTVAYVGSANDLRRLLQRIPMILTGRAPDPYRIARSLQLRIGLVLMSKIRQAFVTKARGGTDEAGIRWAPLLPRTVRRRRGGGRGGVEILRDTGRLLNSLTAGVDAPAPEGRLDVAPGRVIVGSKVPYAPVHHFGSVKRNIPARPFWPLNGKLPKGWTAAMAAALKRGLVAVLVDLLRKGVRP